jgi:hypothetical protein
MKDKDKMIGGIPLSKWKEVFYDLCQIAMDKDYFSDILFWDLYPETSDEIAATNKDDEDAQYIIYNEKWNYAYEALEEIFGERK